MGALKNKIAQLRRLVADLRGELGEVLTRQNDLERSVRNVTKISLFSPNSLIFLNLCFVILFRSPSLR